MMTYFNRTYWRRRAIVAALVAFVSMTSLAVAGDPQKKNGKQRRPEKTPETLFVLFHTHGPKWVDSLGFREQPGVRDHVQYMSSFLADGRLVIGGPFLDDSGGMMVMKAKSMEEARQAAFNDPTVKSGLLNVQVKQWMPALSTVRIPD